ncbi:phosphoenolpyruvate--protein phosphotransferase [Marinobacterium weihaiense]|uniref:phosphoenolpyruvate--protein phosphotransferase n=1 Tax=Marinobacterium weihaiense TaxID=2851016 RepID=A0ABS6M7I0_9GAMM|nr:phosphoenolpyruvate--protein phosphotransferase [Marinobacterium weihaiense]MBV0932244.1 phosphoenolpyruvate--protein phosphotransferase [Marinobacterium weihaiense]
MQQPSLNALTSIVEQIARTGDPRTVMTNIVQRLRDLIRVEVCSLYLCTPDHQHLILAATEGLSPQAVGKAKLKLDEGLVGHIAASLSTLNLGDAPEDDRFVFIPETHEMPYHRFLGVPLIHLRKLVGVLVIQGREREPFSQETEAFLITVASQLAGTLSHLQSQGGWYEKRHARARYRRFPGLKGAPGLGLGKLWLVRPHLSLDQVRAACTAAPEADRAAIRDAIAAVSEELESGSGHLGQHLPGDVSALFNVYQMMLQSPELSDQILARIDAGDNAPWALKQTIGNMAEQFRQADDPYLKARAEDICNIGQRILNQLLSRERPSVEAPDEALILAGELISIADLAEFPLERIHGIICTQGSTLSHTAILANALGIPAVMGVENFQPDQHKGAALIADGHRGECVLNPPPALLAEYRRMIDEEQRFMQGLERLRDQPAVTRDGFQVRLLTNTGLLADATPGLQRGAEGVGLYRSEIPFMIHDSFPTEQEQLTLYRKVLAAYAPRPVSMRTLDIGGDKQLPYFDISESNPYLGWRGIRFTLDNAQLLISQIRAMLRADIGNGNLKLLVPMVSRVDEIQSFRRYVEKAVESLQREGTEVRMPDIGMMIEVPSAMLLLPRLAPFIDFVSIGSNDLTQYLLAVDRNNPRVSALFDHLNPAVLVALEQIRQQCDALSLPVSLCGEMASDPAAVLLLTAMGYDCLSLSAYNIPRIKLLLRSVDRTDLLPLLEQTRRCNSETEVRELVAPLLKQAGWGQEKGPWMEEPVSET